MMLFKSEFSEYLTNISANIKMASPKKTTTYFWKLKYLLSLLDDNKKQIIKAVIGI